MARRLKIHPAIGVARVGNSPDEYFIGPEERWDHAEPTGGYRDARRRLKRQGARFRVFVHEDGQEPRELTAAEAEISWSVRMANTKAAAERFHGIRDEPPEQPLRNPGFPRDQLILEAAAGPLGGPDQRAELVSDRLFMNKPLTVPLGRILTDGDGNLIVLGGYGTAASPTNTPFDEDDPLNYANRDGWYDDVADGPVTATVRMRDGSAASPVVPAWVMVSAPRFAPALENPVTLYDMLIQRAIDRAMIPDPSKAPGFKPSFTDDIYPILRRALAIRWTFANGESRPPRRFHEFEALPGAAAFVVHKLRRPSDVLGGHGVGPGNMPRYWSDDYPGGGTGTLTPLQYAVMQAWARGQFVDDSAGGPPRPTGRITADGLDRAALDACVGGPFVPGMEVSWKFREALAFVEPFRLDATRLKPGDATAQMAVPWQSDFIDCSPDDDPPGPKIAWWPAHRPTDVWKSPGADSVRWDRGFPPRENEKLTDVEIVTAWYRLGFILQRGDAYLEVERVDQELP